MEETIKALQKQIDELNFRINGLNNKRAVLQHTVDSNLKKKEELEQQIIAAGYDPATVKQTLEQQIETLKQMLIQKTIETDTYEKEILEAEAVMYG